MRSVDREKIVRLLQSFSFTPDQIDVYLACLRLGPATHAQITRGVDRSRTATLFHIRKLLEKKVLSISKKKNKRLLVALPPRELLAEIHDKSSSLERLLPQLDALSRIDKETPMFDISESREGYWRVYEELSYLPAGTEFRILEGAKATENELSLLLPHQWEEFWSRIIERNIQTKGIFTRETISSVSHNVTEAQRAMLRKRVWTARFLPQSALPIDQLMILYKDKAAFLFPDTSLVLVLQHRGVFAILSSLFDSLYAFATPVRDPWGTKK